MYIGVLIIVESDDTENATNITIIESYDSNRQQNVRVLFRFYVPLMNTIILHYIICNNAYYHIDLVTR